MGCYKHNPVLCTVWAFFEVVLFGGVIFGWGSLVYILKEEGFYLEECGYGLDTINHTAIVTSISEINTNSTSGYNVINTDAEHNLNVITTGNGTSSEDLLNQGCQAQESKLNLWFTIAVSFMYLAFAGIGNAIRLVGLRIIRSIFLVIYLIGTLCLAFATPDIPWLLLPGLTCIASGGLTILATNMQVANLQPRVRSTIVAIFTGLFDFSSVNKQVIRIAFERGVQRRTSYLIYSALCFVMVGISTYFFLPKDSVTEKHIQKVKDHRRARKGMKPKPETDRSANTEVLLKSSDKARDALDMESTISIKTTPVTEQPTLCATIFSLTFLLHLFWLFVHAFRFVTFIGLMNVWLEDMFRGDEAKVGDMLGVFSYMTMGAIGTALLCGLVYDWQRKCYAHAPGRKRTYMPVILPMSLVIFFSMATTVSCLIRHWVSPYFAFGMFTFLRSWLFTVGVAFIGDSFPIEYFGVLFGCLQFAAGIAGLLQFPVFEWYDAYDGSSAHVNAVLLILQVSTFIHPIVMWIRCRKDKEQSANVPFSAEITVHSGSVPFSAEIVPLSAEITVTPVTPLCA